MHKDNKKSQTSMVPVPDEPMRRSYTFKHINHNYLDNRNVLY